MGSFILRTTSPLLSALLALTSVFMLLRGHHDPGGGFVGGLLLAAAVAVRALGLGNRAARAVVPIAPPRLIGVGLAITIAASATGIVLGAPLLSPVSLVALHGVGVLGAVLLFDLGVYVVVAATAVTILFELSEEDGS